MTTPTRWNPFKTMSRFDPTANLDDLFRGFGLRPQWRDLDIAPDIRIEVAEDDKAFRVKAELPGIDKDDIEVSVDGNQVAISAEVKREKHTGENEREIFTERYYGNVYRAFTLPGDLESDKVDAHYDNGVLRLTLPKKHNGSARRITIS